MLVVELELPTLMGFAMDVTRWGSVGNCDTMGTYEYMVANRNQSNPSWGNRAIWGRKSPDREDGILTEWGVRNRASSTLPMALRGSVMCCRPYPRQRPMPQWRFLTVRGRLTSSTGGRRD